MPFFIHRNLTEDQLVIFDFNVLTSNKIKAPFKLSSGEIKIFQFSNSIPKTKIVEGDIKYVIVQVRLECD